MAAADQPHQPDPRARRADHAQPVRDQDRQVGFPGVQTLFAFTQLDLAWSLGPPDGRYLMRAGALGGDPADMSPSHVVVLASAPELAAAPRLRLRRGPGGTSAPGSDYVNRATIVDVARPLDAAQARAWLAEAGEDQLERDIAILNAVLRAQRLAAADPQLPMLERRQALAARVGYGEGQEVAEGRFTEVRELAWHAPSRPRRRMLTPDGRLAAILTGREHPLVCEELVLRARADLDAARGRQAALQLLIALDAAIAELSGQAGLAERVQELRSFREPVGAAAQAALAGELDDSQQDAVTTALGRVEAALRARAAAAR